MFLNRPKGLFGAKPFVSMGGQDVAPMTPQQFLQGTNDTQSAMNNPSTQQSFAQGLFGAQGAMNGQAQAAQAHHGINWGHVLVDALSGAAGQEGPYAAMAMHKQKQQEAAQIAAQERAASMQDWQSKYQYESDHPKPTAPGEYERSLVASGVMPGTDAWTRANAQRVQHWNDPMVNMTLPNGQVYSGPQSGLAAVLSGGHSQTGGLDAQPTVEDGYSYTPGPGGRGNQANWKQVGGGVSNGTGGFPAVTPGGLDAITVNSESGGNPNAVSPKGARGLWQVMPSTARDPGFGIRPSNGTPSDDARVGAEYRRVMQKRYGGNLPSMWGAYNWGPGAVDAARAKYGEDWLSHAPAETQAYVNKNMQKVRGR